MSENSAIEWCDHTFNPWIGCTKVSPGCDHCYAERREDLRLHRVQWGAGQPRHRTKTWRDPKRWNDAHEAFFAQHGRRQRVFCASLADVFDNEVPQLWRTALFRLIYDTPHLDWLLLTKRIGNAARMLRNDPPTGIDMGSLPNRLYRANQKAALHEDQAVLDDIYGRTCTVPYGVVHTDGSFHEPLEPMAFVVGAMTTFKVGKKAAGRLLDSVRHDGFPA